MRQMTFVAFLQAQNCTNLATPGGILIRGTIPGTCLLPSSRARPREGKFHLGFFDDRLSMPDMYGRDHAHTVEHGIRCVKMDPITTLMVMGMASTRLGLGATYSTTYYEPFHVARVFATLDLMSEGRAAWNVVTSLNDGEAQNMGLDTVVEHDLRYDRADEFMEVVLGHWDSWEDDAIVQDKSTGRFADAAKVHRLDHDGEFFKSRGPFTVPRSPQGHPMIIQAGQSACGELFGSMWGDLIFLNYPDIEIGKKEYKAFKEDVAKFGRDPEYVKSHPPSTPALRPRRQRRRTSMR